jgi:SAM-dependent methyltransferase
MTCVNVGPGPYNAPEPWVNADVADNEWVHPDVVVADADFPLADWPDNSVQRVYLGHVVEHVPWDEIPSFLTDIRRALTPGGEVCVVGPDVLKVIRRWKDNLDAEGWELVESVMENPWDRCYEGGYGLKVGEEPKWKNARHWWNCYEARVVYALEQAGYRDVTPLPITPDALAGWPVVAHTPWQCAVRATK